MTDLLLDLLIVFGPRWIFWSDGYTLMMGNGNRRGMANRDCRYLLVEMLMQRRYSEGMDI